MVPSKRASIGNLPGFDPLPTRNDLPYHVLDFLGFGFHPILWRGDDAPEKRRQAEGAALWPSVQCLTSPL
jgi:hypothetical protein